MTRHISNAPVPRTELGFEPSYAPQPTVVSPAASPLLQPPLSARVNSSSLVRPRNAKPPRPPAGSWQASAGPLAEGLRESAESLDKVFPVPMPLVELAASGLMATAAGLDAIWPRRPVPVSGGLSGAALEPAPLLALPSELLHDIAEESSNAAALMQVSRRLRYDGKIGELAAMETLLPLSQALAASKPGRPVPLSLRGMIKEEDEPTMPYEERISKFVDTLGMPPAADGSGASGALGVQNLVSRQAILDNLSKAADLFDYFVPRGVDAATPEPLSSLFGPGLDTSGPFMAKVYASLAMRAQYPADFLALLGQAPDDANRGGIGILALPIEEQAVPLRELCEKSHSYGWGIEPLLPQLAHAIVAAGDVQGMRRLTARCQRRSEPGCVEALRLLRDAPDAPR